MDRIDARAPDLTPRACDPKPGPRLLQAPRGTGIRSAPGIRIPKAKGCGGRYAGDGRFKSVGFYLDNSTDRLSVDEIRLGTTFASVAPVPEPSTCAAIAGALTLGVLGLRRRRA